MAVAIGSHGETDHITAFSEDVVSIIDALCFHSHVPVAHQHFTRDFSRR